ncbi:acyltransferase [Actinoplanes hulinensis]|uniref:Acyltransferase n=1 Tax=Actinoplanes hulinensis TaxID=1144547 RepID=A0ABS7AUV5_9ACTN|nr:acyltransferase family protein [Actinoplanes hulinensis]MBW6432477.1 acyltransferase [Actinoplanes hulinensis]
MSVSLGTEPQKAQPDKTSVERTASGSHPGFRPDIEGMRAIAVTLVVLSHAGISWVAGGYVGVDVFFVISGFLITTLLFKELSRTGTISLGNFYARRATRLLPASTVVLLLTVAATWLWMPATRFGSIALDAIYATFYGINWRLASEGVQYLNAGAEPSPLQHFWSLAVEEQFYLVWPLLLLILAWTTGRRGGAERRTPAVVVLLLVFVASLAVSVTQTSTAAPWAYFGAHTRAWELAAGALLAVASTRLTRLPQPAAAALTWIGLVAVVGSALLYDEATPFPGYAAVLPVLGAVALIAGGCASPRAGAVLLIGTWPFRQIGKYSYSWYLWHWPVLMIAPHALRVEPGIGLNLGLSAVALVLAIGSYHLVENPARTQAWVKARFTRGLAVGLALSVLAALVAQAGIMNPPRLASGPAAVNTAKAVAAAADPAAELRRIITESARIEVLPSNYTPKVERAKYIVPAYVKSGCHLDLWTVTAPGECVFGDPAGKKTVYLFGDSHAGQWFPALDAIAEERGWKLLIRIKAACLTPAVRTYRKELKREYTECPEWRSKVIDEIKQVRPDMVIMSSSGFDAGGLIDRNGSQFSSDDSRRHQTVADGWAEVFGAIKHRRTRLVMIKDTPSPGRNAPECLAANSKNITACVQPVGKAVAYPERQALVDRAAKAGRVTVIDPVPWFCTDVCPAVVGNLLSWRDDNHISTKYATMVTPLLAARLPR